MKARIPIAVFAVCIIAVPVILAQTLVGPGNPRPGYPHDTIMIHVQKAESGPKLCDGGHSLFVRHVNGVIPEDTYLNITMTDWVQIDNDNDTRLDEDPFVDGVDEDLDGKDGEDGLEPGAETIAVDCDSWGDGELSLQIRDTDPRQNYVSTQEWFIRLVGKPGQDFTFTTYAGQTVNCEVLSDPDGMPNSGDETVQCLYGTTEAEWVRLSDRINLGSLGCVKRVKLGGKGGVSAGGKTPFCDITDEFMVTVEGVADPKFIFSVSCVDNLDTLDVDESLYCPLSKMIWEIDTTTTSQATAQIFVGHTGSASIAGGKITGK